ncbi:alpha/beta fold hydrolase [Actinomarinicola tropica]|uniref:Alpha/beta fold hydrolase n=1 Tax=Actinomarinicola tropica TaxID=2789776 RepID=A0A5Q2RED0_9ACTN|nr:alpha/beta hydrolase [Actinomarinicola tropica]QGG95268.1 alpha/beta fold hydrolase [Actinomarinicola tropica]
MASTDPTAPDFEYDELAYLRENAEEVGLPWSGPPTVERVEVAVAGSRCVSALRWGSGPIELVLVHGSAQNAHTWDTVALALGRPLLAVDLPGHGHSDWRDDFGYRPHQLADDLAVVLEELCEEPVVVVGMSLGGATVSSLAARRPDLVRRVVAVDITPNPSSEAVKDIHDFIAGPQSFPSFAEILERTVQYNPTRSETSLRRGIVHNARRADDGSWQWRYDRRDRADAPEVERPDPWEEIESIVAPYLLVRGGAKGSVVTDEGVDELLRRRPGTEVVVVPDAGHSIQGDQPLELARIIDRFAHGDG